MAGIADLMATQMITASPYETVAEVARRMGHSNVGAVLVVEKGALWGLFSERDLVTRVVGEGRDPNKTDVGDVATRELVTIDVNAPLRSVIEAFRQKRFRHLPVLRDGNPVGILSTRDFFEYIVEACERCIDDRTYNRLLATGVDPYDHPGGSYGR